MLSPILLDADNVRDHFTQLQARRPVEKEQIPLVSYPSPPPRNNPLVILRTNPVSQTKMPFPVARDSEESDVDDTVEQVEQTSDKTSNPAKAPKAPKPEIVFERISPADYKKNESAIKDGLRSNEAEIYTKFPGGKPIPAERFPAATTLSVFVLPAYSGSVEFVYRPDDFPGSFVSFQDKQGERWKCVALWDDEKKKIVYVANIQAEIRLCSELYTGSSKGKVRWEKAVEPRNNIPSNFGSFAVSDRVLLERRKAHWPEALKKLRESCSSGIVKTEPGLVKAAQEPASAAAAKKTAPKKAKSVNDVAAVDGEVKEKAPKEKADKPSRKRKADTYLQVTLSGKSRLVYTAGSGDHLLVEEITMTDGQPSSRNVFSA